MPQKPIKKTDGQLYALLEEKIANGNYVFLKHAKDRQQERQISDIEVLDILEGKKGRNRKHNKIKDQYITGYQDWNYCIEGTDVDGKKIRIIVSFMEDLVPIITVIRIDN